MDTLSALISHSEPRVNLFFSGNLCDSSDSSEYPTGGALHLVRSGELALYEPDGSVQVVSEPTLIIFPKGKAHRMEPRAHTGCDMVCASLVFKDSPFYRALPAAIIFPLSQLADLSHITTMLFNEAFEPHFAQSAIISKLLDLLLLLVIRHLVKNKICEAGLLSALSDPRLAKAIEGIHQQPDYPWTIANLAQRAAMSRARFAALFHQVVGQTPLGYVTESRLLLAQKLLLMGNPIKSVCLEVGYSGSVAFSRAFQRQFGLAPKTWLKQAEG